MGLLSPTSLSVACKAPLCLHPLVAAISGLLASWTANLDLYQVLHPWEFQEERDINTEEVLQFRAMTSP
jgi:hypothetical protein